MHQYNKLHIKSCTPNDAYTKTKKRFGVCSILYLNLLIALGSGNSQTHIASVGGLCARCIPCYYVEHM